MKTSALVIIIVLVVILAGGIYFVSRSGSNTTADNQNSNPLPGSNSGSQSGSDTDSETSRTYNIEISGFAFNPDTLTINQGDTVVWTNKDSVTHTVTSDSGSEIKSSGLSNGETYSHVFNTAGTFDYHCGPHPSMQAEIAVK